MHALASGRVRASNLGSNVRQRPATEVVLDDQQAVAGRESVNDCVKPIEIIVVSLNVGGGNKRVSDATHVMQLQELERLV
jgi:hypothetical protein